MSGDNPRPYSLDWVDMPAADALHVTLLNNFKNLSPTVQSTNISIASTNSDIRSFWHPVKDYQTGDLALTAENLNQFDLPGWRCIGSGSATSSEAPPTPPPKPPKRLRLSATATLYSVQ